MDIETLRAFCLQLPAVQESVKWENDLCFTIGEKMFCVASLTQPFRFSFKVADDAFEELSNSEGFMPAPYMARARWVSVTNPTKLTGKQYEAYIQNSYTLVKAKLTKKLQAELGI